MSKQKSNGQLNGAAKAPATPEEPLPSSSQCNIAEREPCSVSTGVETENGDATETAEELRWRKRGSESSSDGTEQRWDGAAGPVSTQSTRRPGTLTKSKSIQDLSALQIVSTILTSNPAGDTISLLIVLLALPSIVLTMVQALFACLTLMPPSSGMSPVSFLTLFDVFQGSAGSPSLSTMAVVDAICFALWLGLWNWAQNFALDLAQIQIALTLGSGSAGKSGSVSTLCFFLVLLLHSVRSSGLRQFFTSRFLPETMLSHPRIAQYAKYLPSDSEFVQGSSTPSRIKSLFAVHIISQALMAFVRRKVAGTSSTNKTKRLDAELLQASIQSLDSNAQDSAFNTAASPTADNFPPPTPTIRESKDKALTAKKRRRQAAQVRSQQPFWAALASTKVHVLREVEQNKDKATNSAPHDTGRNDSPDSMWITNVEPSSIQFEAGYYVSHDNGHNSKSMAPFHVRINNAKWHSVNLEVVDDPTDDDFATKWVGSIGGLAPDCNYICSFRRAIGDREFASIMIRTPPLADRDQPNTVAPAPIRQSARPNSPTTTLKTSIQTAERSREDANNRRNKVRRNHRNALAKLDREIEQLQNKLKTGGDDNRLRQKLLQFERNARQHEEAMTTINQQLEELETIPEEETVEYDKKKEAYNEQNRELVEANKILSTAKAETNSELNSIKADLAATVARKERLTARNAKLAAEQERLTQANIQNISEMERRAMESAQKAKEQEEQISGWHRRIDDMTAQLEAVNMQVQTVFREIDDAMARANAGPMTPEGELPGTGFHGSRPTFFSNMQPSTFVPDPQASPFQSYTRLVTTDARRPRSNTNQSLGGMSGVSGGDFDEADPIPPMPHQTDFDLGFALNGRKGSGSSRGKNNHSPGIIGGAILTSPQRGTNSPSQLHGVNSW